MAEVGSRLTQVSIPARKMHHSGLIFSNSYQESSEGPASTLPDNEEMEDDEVEEEYMRLVNAWDRTDHVLYPGPLCQDNTLKHDVQAFLRGKVEDIQDRMPVDWDSASLLLAYLELLVKNNGVCLHRSAQGIPESIMRCTDLDAELRVWYPNDLFCEM